MMKPCRFIDVAAALFFTIIIGSLESQAAAPPNPPAVPVPWTQEKVKPPEVEDKEKNKDDPVATCQKVDNKTQEVYHDVIYKDGTKVQFYTQSKKWVIEIPDGKGGKTKITYDPAKKTKTVKEQGKKPVEQDPAKDPGAKKWKEDLEKAEAEEKKKTDLGPRYSPVPVRESALRGAWFHHWLVDIGYYGSIRPASFNYVSGAAPIQLAATVEKAKPEPKQETPKTQGKDEPKQPVNTKVVTFGGPGGGVTIHFEPEDPKTPKPDDYVKNDKPQNTWKPDDVPGPQTTPGPTPGGTVPVDPGTGGGYVNIGGGWAVVRIPYSWFQSCQSGDDDSDDAGGAPQQPQKQSSAPTEEREPRRETIEQRQAREWDQGIRNDIPTPKPTFVYNPEGETQWIKGVREDAANFKAKIAANIQKRSDSCAPGWAWDWAHGNPIWVDEQYLIKRQWMIEIYEAGYIHAREQGLSHLGAHAYGQIQVDKWRQESLDQFVNMMIEHLQNFQGAINGIQVMKAAAEYAEEFLKAKDILRKKELMEKAIKQAKAAQNAPKAAPKNPALAQGGVHEALPPQNAAQPRNPKLNQGGVHPALPAEETGSGTQKYGANEAPPQPKPQAQCPKPTNVQKAQQLKQLEAKIDAKAKKTDELAAKLANNRAGEKDPDFFKENPGTKLTQGQREAMEQEFDKLMGENIKDLSKAIQLRNELYPHAPQGKPSITPSEAKFLLSGKKPLMGPDKVATAQSEAPTGVYGPGAKPLTGAAKVTTPQSEAATGVYNPGAKPLTGADKIATPQTEAPTGVYGPGGTQQLPHTGPGQTQPLRGPGDTQKLGPPYSQ